MIDAEKLRNEVFGGFSPSTSDDSKPENIKETIYAWLDKKLIHRKTRLNGNQIIALTLLKSLSDRFNITCIKNIIDNFCQYKLSENGQSSKELVEILKNRPEVTIDDNIAKRIEPFIK